MKILVVAATKFEVQSLITKYEINVTGETGFFMNEKGIDISVLITGVGMVNTAYFMGKYSHNLFDYIINIGICGAFNRNIELGEIVNIVDDTLSEMGAESGDDFIKYDNMLLGGTANYINRTEVNSDILNNLRKVKAVTVNKVHGNDESIENVKKLFAPEVESMEGAAFFMASENLSGKVLQIRAVSNYVEKRDKSKWNIQLAIKNVNDFTIKLIEDLNTK